MELIARDRRHTDCLKWDKEPGPLQMWVADMEFETLPAVTQALVDRAKQGIFGYGIEPEGTARQYAAGCSGGTTGPSQKTALSPRRATSRRSSS